ncbi:MAG: inorganic pyrophosphatase [Clostridia bacterium]|nr:inorganic pyrophosphatase [Clostridia bacterium]
MLGKIVSVIIDRPLGSVHPLYKNIVYPVNYGYILGVMANDGEEQDAYVVGVNIPLKEFKGKVIAIIHRKNDVEDKLVVAPEGLNLSKEEILKAVSFQEKYFETEIFTLI